MRCAMSEMKKGEEGRIVDLKNKGDIRRRLMDIGFTVGTPVRCVGKSPLGDPTAFLIKGAIIALRAEDSAEITIESDTERAVRQRPWD